MNSKWKKIIIVLASIFCLVIVIYLAKLYSKNCMSISPYPFGKNFTFTVTDDADDHKVTKLKPVYDFLTEIGMRTTITVWSREATRSNGIPDVEGTFDYGETLQREDYRNFILDLKAKGFEIALHTVSGGNDTREETIKGYEYFKDVIGEYPKINIMHSKNLEDIYWGSKVINSYSIQWIINNIVGLIIPKPAYPFGGEIKNSPYFWGDILKERTKYVRLWGTSDINTLRFNPSMPYHDSNKPYVNYWFSFSDGFNGYFFNKLISDKNIKKLVKERGTSIVYAHFASGFSKKDSNGNYFLDPYFKEQIMKLSQQKEGWFVPASTILDRLLVMKNISLIENKEKVTIVNSNQSAVEGVTLLVKPKDLLYDSLGKKVEVNDEGEIILENIKSGESITFFRNKDARIINEYPTAWEQFNMIMQRGFIWLFSHNY